MNIKDINSIKFDISIDLKKPSIACNGLVLFTRSRSLVVFVCCLLLGKSSNPRAPWVDIEALRQRLPSVHGRQMKRYVDALTEIAFPIGFECKTRGRYFLNASDEEIAINVDVTELERFLSEREQAMYARESIKATTSEPGVQRLKTLCARRHDSLIDSLNLLNKAELQFRDGNLINDVGHAYPILQDLVQKAVADVKAMALLKLAEVCTCVQRYDEAQNALRVVQCMLRDGEVAANQFQCKTALRLARLRLDQGRYDEARFILDKQTTGVAHTELELSEFFNLKGCLAEYDLSICQSSNPDKSAQLLVSGVDHFTQALLLANRSGSYQDMHGICVNFSSIYLTSYKFQASLLGRTHVLKNCMDWVNQSEFIRCKFGVGMDSVKSRIILLKAAIETDLSLDDLAVLTNSLFKSITDLEAMAQSTLTEAIRISNRIEQAQALEALGAIADIERDKYHAANYKQQAVDIYQKLNRSDLVLQLKKTDGKRMPKAPRDVVSPLQFSPADYLFDSLSPPSTLSTTI